MIYIVHGENLSKSRALILNQQKKLMVRYRQEFHIEELSPEDLATKLRSLDIFGEPQFFVIDVSGSGRSNLEAYINAMSLTPPHTTLVILSEKKLPPTNAFIKNARTLKAQILENKSAVQGNSFDFVDAVMRKDRPAAYKFMRRELSRDKDPFELFSLLLYGMRSLAQVKFQSPSSSGLKPFVLSKQKRLCSIYDTASIRKIFRELLNLDCKAKTGEISPDIMLTLAVEKVINS